MVEKLPPPRPGYQKTRSGDAYPSDRDRADRARQAAEALFAPKPGDRAPTATARPVIDRRTPAPAATARPVIDRRTPAPAATARPVIDRRTLAPAASAALPAISRKRADAAAKPAASANQGVPAAHATRIRTWLKYGMTVAEVAAVYGVPAGEIERLLGDG
jgi:hypothetical protein